MQITSRRMRSRDIQLQFMKYLRSVILPIIIQINARTRVSLVKINARFFPVGNMTLLINLKKAEHRNNELFAICFRYCLAYLHLSKVNLPLISETNGGKTKTG